MLTGTRQHFDRENGDIRQAVELVAESQGELLDKMEKLSAGQLKNKQTAEAVDEDDGTDVCVDLRCAVCFGQAFPQTLFDAVQEAVQHGVLQLGVVEMVA